MQRRDAKEVREPAAWPGDGAPLGAFDPHATARIQGTPISMKTARKKSVVSSPSR